MAQKLDYFLPFNDLTQYIPNQLRNSVNAGLTDNLFNRFMTKDESVPLYGYVGQRPSSTFDRSPRIPQLSVERDINAVVPVLNFQVGSETYAYTVQDILNKAKVLGIDTNDLAWMYSQGNNFRPPINFDKFTNFFDYYWVAKALPTVPSSEWNSEALPEYYVIAPPLPTDNDKLNVVAASTDNLVLTGSGFTDQVFKVEFTSADTFTVSTSSSIITGPGGIWVPVFNSSVQTLAPTIVPSSPTFDITQSFSYAVTRGSETVTLLTFTITREPTFDLANNHVGYTGFATGDTFFIETSFLSSNYNITYNISGGVKARISGVSVYSQYQKVDDHQLNEGDRVLVKSQAISSDNGIYVVSRGQWVRASDFSIATAAAGAIVFVTNGTAHGNTLWQSAGSGPYTWSQIGSGVDSSNTNDWQEGNYWVKGSDLVALGIDRSSTTQALRPIIEFDGSLQLNSSVGANGVPNEGSNNFKQRKTEFNQLPLFDLFRYDGTHSSLVSPVFYYVEDLSAELDVELQKRIKLSTNDSSDLLFNHGLADADGSLLFFKKNGQLHTVWHAGYLDAEIIDSSFIGVGAGTLTNVSASELAQQQVWTITAISPTVFKVAGSKMPQVPLQATVGTAYDNGQIAFTINAGATAFVAGDAFTIRVGNLERPRYVFRDADESVQDLYGGAAADISRRGAYEVSRTFYNNPYNDGRAEMAEGSLYSHFRSVLATQTSRLPIDYALGGNMKLWSEQHTLLASLMMQRDFTPTSMIEMAKRQYETGLNAIRDLYQQWVVEYFSSNQVVTAGNTAQVTGLLDFLLEKRAQDNDVRTVLFDSTAACVGFPATLPQLGLAPLVQPEERFDRVLGINVLVHHDGHLSSRFQDTFEFRDTILGNYVSKLVARSDGTETPAVGSFTVTPPASPYKGELWMRTANGITDILAFDVTYDTEEQPPMGVAGELWFKRSTGILRESNGLIWVQQPSSLSAWKRIDLAAIINQMLLIVEQRLHAGINPTQRRYDFSPVLSDSTFSNEMRRELFSFAALNNLDPLGTNYLPGDAFTWNYSLSNPSNFPSLSGPQVPARWYNVLKSHHASIPGVVPTERPDVEPWKLFGFTTYVNWTASVLFQPSYQSAIAPPDLSNGSFINGGMVRAVSTTSINSLFEGLLVVDGVSLNNGDLLLLQSQTVPANNGIWRVSTSSWTRAGTLVANMYVGVSEGSRYANTQWYLTAAVPTIHVDPVVFAQARYWSESMWNDLVTLRPGLRTSVNPWTDELLAPYVNPGLQASAYALTSALPQGIALPFRFGEGSPVEEAWTLSIEYNYALCKSLARFDPLALLGFAWGFNWVEVDGILYDGFDINMPGHKRFRLHGEDVKAIDRTGALVLASVTTATDIELVLTYDAYDINRKQSFSIRQNGVILGTTTEGTTASVSLPGIVLNGLLINDFGRPFRIGDTFKITALTGGSAVTTQFIPATSHRILGLGQTFTNALREISVDTKSSFAINAFRGWDVNMGFRAGSLVSTDDLTIFNDNDTLNASSFDLIIKKNEIARDAWLQALRVTVLAYGSKGLTQPTQTGSEYRGTEINAPAGSGDDWVFRIEGYNPRYNRLDFNTLQQIASGVEFPTVAPIGQRFFRHDLGALYVFSGTSWDVTQSTDLVTFNALDKSGTPLTWFQPTKVIGRASTMLPITITGVQNLISFLFSYANWADEEGWRFSSEGEFNTDLATGRQRNWQLEIERMVDGIYRGIELGAGIVINPFIDRVWIEQATGLLSEFTDSALFDITGNPGVFDVLGVRYQRSDVRPSRGNLTSSIGATGPMFSVHAQFDEYEHLFIFANFVDESTDNGLLYDPFSGSRAVTYKFIGRRAANKTLRPEFGGHYIAGGLVRQNMQASTDALARAYDANYAFEDVTTSKHALQLLGFNTKDYLANLDISDKTQFNFWRGLIQSKGTNLSVSAYLNNDRFQDAKIDEYWAYKIAEYGDSRQLTFPEMRLEVADSLQQFTLLQFDAVAPLTNFTQISRLDETRWFSIEDLNQDAYFKAEVVGTLVREVVNNQVILLPFVADKLIITGVGASAVVINATTVQAAGTGQLTIVGYGPAVPRYNPIKLFNYVDNELIEEIPHWHPAAGQHAPIALEAVNIIGPLDPARYSYSTLVQGNSNFDPLRPWGDRERGRVWFDTRNLDYLPYYDNVIFPNRAERLSRWGALADYATVDVYEWVKSTVPPLEYAALAAVEAPNADISSSSKASGEVALQETYYRDRNWFIRPIAWSKTGTVFGGHPAFNDSYDADLILNGLTYGVDQSTFSEYGVTVGMRIGAWDPNPDVLKPLSEAIILENTKLILLDDEPFSAPVVNGNYSITIEPSTYVEVPSADYVFTAIPITPVLATADVQSSIWDVVVKLRMINSSTGQAEDITLHNLQGVDGATGTPATGGSRPVLFNYSPTAGQATGIPSMSSGSPATPGSPAIPGTPATADGRGSISLFFSTTIDLAAPTNLPALDPSTNSTYVFRTIYSGTQVTLGYSGTQMATIGAFKGALEASIFTFPTATVNSNVMTILGPNRVAPIEIDIPWFGMVGVGGPTQGVFVGGFQAGPIGQPATPGTPAVPPTPAIPGGPISYSTSVTIDGISYTVNTTGPQVQTFGALLAVLDAALPGTVALVGNSIVITSPTTGANSSVSISSSLFNQMSGFTGIGAGSPGQPYLPPVFVDPYRGAALVLEDDQLLTFESPTFGVVIKVVVNQGDTFTPNVVQEAIADALFTRVSILDAINVQTVVDASILSERVISNTPGSPAHIANGGIGWRAWNVPPQAELDADSQAPYRIWKPYIGDFVPMWPTQQILADALVDDRAPLRLNDGTLVPRYNTSWQEWQILTDSVYPPAGVSPTSTSTGPVAFSHTENVDATRTTVYINGIAQLRGSYSILGRLVIINDVKVGNNVRVIIRKYQPTATELAFNPDVADDKTFQRQYKLDYEYSTFTTRDTDGEPSTTFYYFWVKNREVAAFGKKLSTQAIAQYLVNGPPSYLTFQPGDDGLLGIGTSSDPFRYDAISVSGLSYQVTKDSTFKLRFTRNFTLRDDPQQLELKNTHTEWGLIRPTQKVRVPERLWNKLVDSMVGQDAGGNRIPSLRRSLYDERTGSTTRYGFGPEQTLAPLELLRSSVRFAILNTKLTTKTLEGILVPDFITALDFSDPAAWFSTGVTTRQTMTTIWTQASPLQINEIFFAALEDVLANNLELTDIFKTSRLSAYSTRTAQAGVTVPIYE